jgi:molybdenum cofactor cytidylyltransferase
LLAAFERSGKGIAVPVYRGRTGHPAVFSLKYRDQIVKSADCGVRSLIYDNPQDLLKVEVDVPDVILDIDTIADYERISGTN